MKQDHVFFAIVFISSILLCNAQIGIKPTKTVIPQREIPTGTNLELQKLTFYAIKKGIEKGDQCYKMGVSIGFVEKQANNLKAGPQVAYAMAEVKEESVYLRSNFMLLRSDKQFSRAYGNTFEVIIIPDRNGVFNPNNVKLTWRFPDIGVKTFLLENVHIQNHTYGVTITGDALIDGKKMLAVSIALAEVQCLI